MYILLLIASIVAILILIVQSSTPLFIYHMSGGIAGLREELTVFPDGRAIYKRGGEELRGNLDKDTLRAFEILLEGLSRSGFSEISPRSGAADFFSYELICPRKGERFTWVDEWASEIKLPLQLKALSKLLDYTVSEVRGERWVNGAVNSSAYVRIEASLSGFVVVRGKELILRAEVRNLGPTDILYDLPTPCHPDVKVETDLEAEVRFTKPPSREFCAQVISHRKLPPDGILINEAVILIGDKAKQGLHWLKVSFPRETPSVEVMLPLLVLG